MIPNEGEALRRGREGGEGTAEGREGKGGAEGNFTWGGGGLTDELDRPTRPNGPPHYRPWTTERMDKELDLKMNPERREGGEGRKEILPGGGGIDRMY